ncbi:MAG TPA: sugar-binding protein [Phycisphaerae bacterium]|nr:sugar-binding protein [Phycisphaerae bacterium]HRY70075.1 sugar-binding protein [Phycisphaerae bacterium]HSA27351.1 sugar-binding protein [Phycisphaerae bacterium]
MATSRSGLAALFLCLALVSGPAFAAHPQITAPYVTSSITVDGSAADWTAVKARQQGISFYKGDGRAGTSATNTGTTICGTISSENDCRVDLWAAHDGTHLFILAEVRDDAYEPLNSQAQGNMAYLEDTLHLYLDSTNARQANIPGSPIQNRYGYEQFGISTDGNIYGENVDFNNSTSPQRRLAPLRSAPDGQYWQAKCQFSQPGPGYLYTFEESILMAGRAGYNMAPLTPGSSYGFNAEFCDADSGIQLQGYIFWSSYSAIDAWNQENLWGTLNLAPVPEPATVGLLLWGALLLRRTHRPGTGRA